MLFIDFHFVRFVDLNPVYEADVTNGEVVDAVNNGDLIVARMPIVNTSGPTAGVMIGYETIPGVVYVKSSSEEADSIQLQFHSNFWLGDLFSDPEVTAATDKIIIVLS